MELVWATENYAKDIVESPRADLLVINELYKEKSVLNRMRSNEDTSKISQSSETIGFSPQEQNEKIDAKVCSGSL